MDNLKKIRQYQSPSTSTINYVTPAPPLPPRRSSPITLSGQSCERYVQRIEWFANSWMSFFPVWCNLKQKSIGICIERVQAIKEEWRGRCCFCLRHSYASSISPYGISANSFIRSQFSSLVGFLTDGSSCLRILPISRISL